MANDGPLLSWQTTHALLGLLMLGLTTLVFLALKDDFSGSPDRISLVGGVWLYFLLMIVPSVSAVLAGKIGLPPTDDAEIPRMVVSIHTLFLGVTILVSGGLLGTGEFSAVYHQWRLETSGVRTTARVVDIDRYRSGYYHPLGRYSSFVDHQRQAFRMLRIVWSDAAEHTRESICFVDPEVDPTPLRIGEAKAVRSTYGTPRCILVGSRLVPPTARRLRAVTRLLLGLLLVVVALGCMIWLPRFRLPPALTKIRR